MLACSLPEAASALACDLTPAVLTLESDQISKRAKRNNLATVVQEWMEHTHTHTHTHTHHLWPFI